MAGKLSSRVRGAVPRHLTFLITTILVVGILYLGKPVVVPLALSVLLAFILTPLVVFTQRRGLNRVPAVLLVVLLSGIVFGAVAWGVGSQVTRLARDMPAHADEVKAKISRLQDSGAGTFSRLFAAFKSAPKDESKPHSSQPDAVVERTVVVAPPEASGLDRLEMVASAVLEPMATAGLILILVIFMLIKREDLRNRVIGLLGHSRLTGTTRVLVESAERISRLLLMQLCINATFGFLFGLALLCIGVPYWFLWGFLTVILRFVPYVGSWMAAAFPVLLSFAISPGLGQPLLVLGIFAVLDLTTANAIEPLIFGHSTGVSPVALLVAAVFWTWVWGPIGLVLSTPLTVCLVVLGQHVPRLSFLSTLLGDQPALPPHLAFYQRLLAGDREEARLIARQHTTTLGAEKVPDDVLVPALRLARRDRESSGLTPEDEAFIFDATQSVLDDLKKTAAATEKDVPASLLKLPVVIGCPAHHRAEELTLQMLAELLKATCQLQLVSTRALPAEIEAQIEQESPALVFIAVIPPGGLNQARYLCRRLRKRFENLKIVVGYFGKTADFDRLLVRLRSAGASYVSTSVAQSQSQIRSLLPAPVPEKENVAFDNGLPVANAVLTT